MVQSTSSKCAPSPTWFSMGWVFPVMKNGSWLQSTVSGCRTSRWVKITLHHPKQLSCCKSCLWRSCSPVPEVVQESLGLLVCLILISLHYAKQLLSKVSVEALSVAGHKVKLKKTCSWSMPRATEINILLPNGSEDCYSWRGTVSFCAVCSPASSVFLGK